MTALQLVSDDGETNDKLSTPEEDAAHGAIVASLDQRLKQFKEKQPRRRVLARLRSHVNSRIDSLDAR